MQLEKLKNILRMDSLDDEVLLESCCYHQEREKNVGLGNIFNKNRQGVYHNLLQEIGASDRGSHFR